MNSQLVLILDFGGVISKTMFETHAQSELALGLSPGRLTWRGPFDVENDPLWQAMQADQITEREYWLTRTRETGEMIGKSWTRMAEFLIATRSESPNDIIRPEFIDLLAKVKNAGNTVAILSNELDLFYGPDFRGKLDFLDQIDLIHDATYTKTLKPDRAAYDNLVQELGVQAADCVFVDDQMRNVTGASKAGWQTVHFDVLNPTESYDQVAQILSV